MITYIKFLFKMLLLVFIYNNNVALIFKKILKNFLNESTIQSLY